jgi:AmmeMemoRadiSam system protein B/AmmeMemoRadiSam system protein A
MLETYLQKATLLKPNGQVIGFILPHAGFVYSGLVAAYGYKIIRNLDRPIKTAIVIGFNHRYHHQGMAVCGFDSYTTPLGETPIDKELSQKLTKEHKNIYFLNEAFINENSTEMHIPFIQTVLPESKLVIVHIGDQTLENCEVLAQALYKVLKGKDDFVLIGSTDMSHFLSYDKANQVDDFSISEIKKFNAFNLYTQSKMHGHSLMCGTGAVCATMMASKKLGADSVEILKYANSGDVTGDTSRVVGYLSAAMVKQDKRLKNQNQNNKGEDMGLSLEDKKTLLQIARQTLKAYLAKEQVPEFEINSKILMENRGAFVTLHKHGRLRGCIGNMVGTKPLYLTVSSMAIEAATGDPRFPKVTLSELADIDIEVSVLSPLEKVASADKITLGKHGVIVKRGFRQGVYLPQVATETGWSKEEFLSSLCASKAGLSPDAWKDKDTDLIVFTAEVFSEKELK